MSYQIMIKNFKGHDYAYVYKSVWDKTSKKPRKIYWAYLGAVHNKNVQKIIQEFKAGKREFFKRKRIKRVPEIDLEDIRTLSLWEKVFLGTAIVVKEKVDVPTIEEVCELARGYCERAGVKQPVAWDEIIDYFKMHSWIEVRADKVKLLLPKSKLREIKKVIAKEPEIRGEEILRAEKEKIRKAVIDF